ncbi:MAG: hypothetical protein ACYC9M_15650, partial [Desulfobulbaceae bacterium]
LSETDEIIILEQGEIADRGNHQELLARNGFYQTMHAKQAREGERATPGTEATGPAKPAARVQD